MYSQTAAGSQPGGYQAGGEYQSGEEHQNGGHSPDDEDGDAVDGEFREV